MRKTSAQEIHLIGKTFLVIYALIFTFIAPIQIFSKTFPSNSVFNQKATQTKAEETPQVDKSFGNIPVYFEQNNGQFNSKVRYFARGTSGYSLFLTGTEAVYVLQDKSQDAETRRRGDAGIDDFLEDRRPKTENRKAVAVYMRLAGAYENAVSTGLERMSHNTNYFKGEESNWRTEIPNYRQVRLENIYQGIDAVWKGKESGGVQYDFIVKPNADPNLIEWEIEGANEVEIDEKGDLLIKTEYGEIRQQKPFTFQENTNGFKQEIESNFKIESTDDEQLATNNYRVKFELGNYNRSKVLTIDPSVNLSNLSFSTFLGGSENDFGDAIGVDRAGNVYVTGQTRSASFPISSGTLDTSYNGSSDVFVTKLNATGSVIIFSTFLGGDNFDDVAGIAVDMSGNTFLVGSTEDGVIDFPTTSGAYGENHNGNRDVFITKLNSTGTGLIFSTLIGGGEDDFGLAIAINAVGDSFITGRTEGTISDYPTTMNAFDENYNGGGDVFVTKLNRVGTGLIYSTFLGGSSIDSGQGIVLDSSDNAVIVGQTFGGTPEFPTTPGAFDESFGGNSDGFVTKLNSSGSGLIYSTFLGGSSGDSLSAISIDSVGNTFQVGICSSSDYPITLEAFDVTQNGSFDACLSKLSNNGSTLIYSTFIGGSSFDSPTSIALDKFGNAVIGGITDSGTTYPTTSGAYDNSPNGGFDAFVTKFNSTGSALIYSTYIGGGDDDSISSIAVDSNKNVFVTGNTSLSPINFPTTGEAFQVNHNGLTDAIVTKFGDFSISGRTVDTSGNALENTAVAMSGDGTGFMLSDADGYFYFGDTLATSLVGGDYLVTATQILYNFNPPNYQVNVNRNKQITFVGRPTSSGPTAAPADIGGEVRSTAGNVGLPNTKLTLIDVVSGDVFETTSDASGDYEFAAITTGMFYLVVPEREGYNFNPGIYEVNHLEQNLGLDFVASPNSPRPVNDFDGDGKTDLAVFRPESGAWYVLNSQDNSLMVKQFGLEDDIPVASDYDGDNRADIAVYRPTEGKWYWLDSEDGEFHAVHFGQSGDLPVQADFDGDGKTDLAVYRPSSGVWHKLNSSDGQYNAVRFGIETDVPVATDYDSDGKADLTVYRDGIWYRLRSSDEQVEAFQFGLEGDKPQVGDFDGDGRIDTAVYRPSNGVWYWLESSDGDFQAKQFGNSTDIPTPADYNGDGRFEQAVFRNGTWFVLRADNSYYSAQFGQTGDVPIP